MLIILITIILGLFISLITLPLGYYAPEWMLLVITYWAIALPSNNKLFLAFLIGIIVDIVYGQVLGISSLFYVLLIYIILRLYNSLRYMTIAQQAVVLFIFIFLKQHLLVWAYFIIDRNIDYQALLVGSIVSASIWPIIYYALRFIRRKFNIGGIN
mgnify:FL=1|tara:strand:- start:725 stop:1192 length:468 start_codon:yes stop_codon:yes gene_type:complete